MFTAGLENELLIVRGGDGADKVHLRQSSDGLSIEVGTQSFRNEGVQEIVIVGDGGGGPDKIYGAQGNDTINGRGGNDIIWGGPPPMSSLGMLEITTSNKAAPIAHMR